MKGCLAVLLSIAVLTAGYFSLRWYSSASGNDLNALAQQAEDYFGYDTILIEEVEKRGNYLAALGTDVNENRCMCVFERDRLFKNRWRAAGGKPVLTDGSIGSWNYGSPQSEAVLIFCGRNIPDTVCWYQFQNGNITYTCPVENNTVLDIFVILDSHDINGSPILLDRNQQEIIVSELEMWSLYSRETPEFLG